MKNVTKYAAILFLIAVVALISISGTYAKYTSSIQGSDSVVVAKWDIEIAGNKLGTTQASFTAFNLFDTVVDTNDDQTETDVAAERIAPGTKGEFSFEIKNNSEVTAEYTIDYTTEKTAEVPIEFSIDGTNWTTELADITTATNLPMGESDTVTIMWRWAFTGDASENFTASQTDVTDTTLGIATTVPQVTLTATINVEQVD